MISLMVQLCRGHISVFGFISGDLPLSGSSGREHITNFYFLIWTLSPTHFLPTCQGFGGRFVQKLTE